MKTPRFLYFDLGMVLLDFSVERMLRQMAAVSGVSPETLKEILFDRGLMQQYETGAISTPEFYELFCVRTGTRPDYDALCRAGSEIFSINVPMLPIVVQLRQAGYRLGILSNTCECHWRYCSEHYRFVNECFHVHALSYCIGAVKPEAAAFNAAAELAGCRSEEMFFVDDIPAHVEGAKAVGIDAIHYSSAAQVAEELHIRGLRFNY
ncbi:MAG: HAD family phosphatase [Thermoguttaceae bacterium]|jgi:putative hydrolase of the HAD superfamily